MTIPALELLQLSEREPVMAAIINSFWDESGKFKDQKVVAFCGVASGYQSMSNFTAAWLGLLRRTGLPFLSMKKALKHHVDFSPTLPARSLPERIEALKPFIACIKQHVELGVQMAVDVAEFHKMPQWIKGQLGWKGHPHYMMFTRALQKINDHAHDDDRINFACDDDEETALPCYDLWRRLKKLEPWAKKKLVSLTFADDTIFPPLQAADVLASLGRIQATQKFFGGPHDYAELYEFLISAKTPGEMNLQAGFWGKADLEQLVEALKQSKARKSDKTI